MLGLLIIIAIIYLYLYMKPRMDIDEVNSQIIIHYWWRGVRRTYVIKDV